VNTSIQDRRLAWFFAGFLLVALVVAGGLSYFASSAPDGLDAVTQHGCQITEVEGQEQLDGTCIAQHATDSATAASPLAGYAVGGAEGSNGPAGVIGVLVCAAVGGALFRFLRRRGHGGP
jgi:cobalt/nickel transport protein